MGRTSVYGAKNGTSSFCSNVHLLHAGNSKAIFSPNSSSELSRLRVKRVSLDNPRLSILNGCVCSAAHAQGQLTGFDVGTSEEASDTANSPLKP